VQLLGSIGRATEHDGVWERALAALSDRFARPLRPHPLSKEMVPPHTTLPIASMKELHACVREGGFMLAFGRAASCLRSGGRLHACVRERREQRKLLRRA